MGCDIHMMAEKKTAHGWEKVGNVFKSCFDFGKKFTDEPYDGRNYNLFAILASVRNGFGVAGIETGDGFNTIAQPRGIPSDASEEYRALAEEYGDNGHSHSYLSLTELIQYNWDQITTLYGVVNKAQFIAYLTKGRPDSYLGGIWGPNIRIVTNDEMRQIISDNTDANNCYTQVEWEVKYRECAEFFLNITIPTLQKIADECGGTDNVRIVFFFDN